MSKQGSCLYLVYFQLFNTEFIPFNIYIKIISKEKCHCVVELKNIIQTPGTEKYYSGSKNNRRRLLSKGNWKKQGTGNHEWE